jgi:S1-C subfamily serine protease
MHASKRILIVLTVLFCRADSIRGSEDSANPRRTRTVETIEQVGAGVVAIFVNEAGQQRSGSGSILDDRGYIVTNDHVVGGGEGIVLIRDLPPLKFRRIGRLWERDLALIKVDAPVPLTAIPLGRSHDLLAGEPILLGGNPGGRGIAFTSGIVSAPSVMPGASALVGVYFPGDTRDRFIQFDAASNPGNSGGPLVNAEGRQIGVVSGKIKDEENVNYAIPVDRFLRFSRDLVLAEERGGFSTGLQFNGAELKIESVVRDSGAEAAGLRAGDVLTRIGGRDLSNPFEFWLSLAERKPLERVPLEWTRAAETLTGAMELREIVSIKGGSPGKVEPGLTYRLHRGRVSRVPDPAKLGEPLAMGVVPEVGLEHVTGLPEDDFVMFLEGWLEVPAEGVYWLAIQSDDGSRVWLDGEPCIDHDGPHPASWATARRRLAAGPHAIRIGYFELSGDADLEFEFGNDNSRKPLPAKWSHTVP